MFIKQGRHKKNRSGYSPRSFQRGPTVSSRSSATHEFTGAGPALVVHESGDPRGPDVVLLHGAQDLPVSFDPVLASLSAWHVWRPELRGHGTSEHPGSYTLAQFVADLHVLIERFITGPVVLIGHSLGGHICGRYASLYPERVRALALLDGQGPPRGPRDETVEGRRLEARRRIDELARSALKVDGGEVGQRAPLPDVATAAQKLLANNPGLGDERAGVLAAAATEPCEGGVRWRFDQRIHSLWTSFSQEENEAHWSAIRCPVLIVTGDRALDYWTKRRPQLDDPARYAAELQRRESLFARATSRVIADAGHMLHYDQPAALAECLEAFVTGALAVDGAKC